MSMKQTGKGMIANGAAAAALWPTRAVMPVVIAATCLSSRLYDFSDEPMPGHMMTLDNVIPGGRPVIQI